MIGPTIRAIVSLAILLTLLSPGLSLAFDIDVTRVALETDVAPNTQDITFSNFDEDCTVVTCVAIFFVSSGITDGIAAATRMNIIGFTDGTNDESVTAETDDGVGTTNTDRTMTDLAVIKDDAVDIEAVFSAWLSNGIRISITNEPTTAWLATVVIIGGSDISVNVGSFVSNVSVDGTTDVASVGFEADAVLFAGARLGSNPGASTTELLTFGVAVNDGADTQGSIGCYSENGQATANPHAITSTLYAAALTDNGGVDTAIQVGTWDSSGFTATTKVVGTAAYYSYLAMAFGGPDSTVVDIDTPTSTGADSVTIGFKTLFGMIFGTLAQAYDTDEADSDGGQCMVSFLTADAQYSISGGEEDAATTTNSFSLSNDQIVTMEQDDGSCVAGSCFQATLTSISSSAWDLNYSFTFTDAARKWIGFAVEVASRRRGAGVIQ